MSTLAVSPPSDSATRAQLYNHNEPAAASTSDPDPEQSPQTTTRRFTFTTFDPSPPQNTMGSRVFCLDDDYGDGDERPVGCCCCCWFWFRKATRSYQVMGLCTSLVTLFIGVSLLIVSTLQAQENGAEDSLHGNALVWTREETQEYYLWLRQVVESETLTLANHTSLAHSKNTTTTISSSSTSSASHLWIPDSPEWRALQWMTLQDPLRDTYYVSTSETSTQNSQAALQRFTLATLYYEWAGPGWDLLPQDGWPQPDMVHSTDSLLPLVADNSSMPWHECAWQGIACNDQDQVTSLVLQGEDSGVALVGTLSPRVAHLGQLQELVLSSHKLRGTLPASWASLSDLQTLDLSFNRLVDLDADLLAQWKNLEYLDVSNNQWSVKTSSSSSPPGEGALTGLTQLSQLQHLDLSANQGLEGDIFAMLLQWPNLKHLNVGGTQLSGSLPHDVGRLTQLEALIAGYAHFQGTIPTSMAKLTNLKHWSMGASEDGHKGLIGSIPTEIGVLGQLEFLSFSNNQRLNTTLPTELGLLTNLHTLDFAHMPGLHGTLPTELGNLNATLSSLFFELSSLTGTLPTELTSLSNLEGLNIIGTQIQGNISEVFCTDLPRLQYLRASCSPVFGTISMCSCCTCGRG